MNVERIKTVWPSIGVREVQSEHGTILVLTGKNSKAIANTIARENYMDGIVDTLWRDVRYGVGYAVPMYDNPMNAIL